MLNSTLNDSISCPKAETIGKISLTVLIVFHIIVITLAVFGNVLIIIVVSTRIKMQTFTNILICNCAATDLIITIFAALLGLIDTLLTKGKWYLGSFMCSFVYFSITASVAANIVTLLVLSTDRLLSVIFPYKKVFKTQMLKFIIPLIWVMAFGFGSPETFSRSVKSEYNDTPVCMEHWYPPFKKYESPKHYTIILFVCLYAVPLFLMAMIYMIIAKKLGFAMKVCSMGRCIGKAKGDSALQSMELAEQSDSNKTLVLGTQVKTMQTFQKGKVIQMLILLLLVFAFCWFPVYLLQFILYFHPFYSRCSDALPKWAHPTAIFVQYAKGAIDPLLYFYFSSNFRKELKILVETIYRKRRGAT